MDFGGFDSSRILTLRSGIPRPIGNFPERLSQAILVGIILVGRLGVRSRLYRYVRFEKLDRQSENREERKSNILFCFDFIMYIIYCMYVYVCIYIYNVHIPGGAVVTNKV